MALLGQKFMGRAHSNAYGQAGRFFDLPLRPHLHSIAGRAEEELERFAAQWGWQRWTSRWLDVVEDPDVHLVDVATPNDLHADPSLAALASGKHVACEKPLAGTLADARAMAAAATEGARKGLRTFVWFNYRRTPAVGLAHRLIREGRVGRIYHVRAQYLQSWGGPQTPFAWRFEKRKAGSGAHGDLNAHLVDLARFLTGDEVVEVAGALAETFIRERPLPGKARKKGKSDVDDCLLFLATFRKGAVASFEASRLAAPHKNGCSIEINGELGSLRFDFDHMNVLELYDAADPPREGGWRRIACTTAEAHPYVESWWPEGHWLGYEHGFVNQTADMMRALAGKPTELPLADFSDGYEVQRVLEAAERAAKERCAVSLDEVR